MTMDMVDKLNCVRRTELELAQRLRPPRPDDSIEDLVAIIRNAEAYMAAVIERKQRARLVLGVESRKTLMLLGFDTKEIASMQRAAKKYLSGGSREEHFEFYLARLVKSTCKELAQFEYDERCNGELVASLMDELPARISGAAEQEEMK